MENETNPEVIPAIPNEDASGDPLDKLFSESPEKVLEEAKKFRGIAHRLGEKPPKEIIKEVPVIVEKPKESPYLTKEDFYRSNTKKARVLLDQEIQDNFDEIAKLAVSRRGQETPEDIAEDYKDAFVVWKFRKGDSKENPAADLATTGVRSPSGGAPKEAPKKEEEDPRFRIPTPPTEWYPKPSK